MNKVKTWLQSQIGEFCLINSVLPNENFEFILNNQVSNIELYLSRNNERVQTIATNIDDIVYELYNLCHYDIILKGEKTLYDIYDRQMLDIMNRKQICIPMNKVIGSFDKNQSHYIRLLRIYDKEGYKPYDHTDIHNRALNGLTKAQNEISDDYCWGGATIEEIEESPERYNASWYQDVFYGQTVWRIM